MGPDPGHHLSKRVTFLKQIIQHYFYRRVLQLNTPKMYFLQKVVGVHQSGDQSPNAAKL